MIKILCFIIWMYILWVFERAELKFYKFVCGSVGLFIFMMIYLEPIFVTPLTKLVAYVAGLLGEVTGLYDSYYQHSMLFIPKYTAAVSLYIDFECSGIVEMMAFLSLLWFFNIYKRMEKIILSIVGIISIFAANVIRIFAICIIIYLGGNDMYYFAHSIFGRLIFYAMSVSLYFYVFTKGQIIRQKVGGFSYQSTEKQDNSREIK